MASSHSQIEKNNFDNHWPSRISMVVMILQIVIAVVLLTSWTLYFLGSQALSKAEPEVMNEWVVFAFLGMLIAGIWHLLFLLFSIENYSARKSRRPRSIFLRSIIIIILGCLPMLLVCYISIDGFLPLMRYLF